MRIAVLQTMYDEHKNVLENIGKIKKTYPDSIFLVTHSFDKESSYLNGIQQTSHYKSLSNLESTLDKYKFPAYVITRNYSDLFKRFYELNTLVDMVVALTGDTKIVDVSSFERRYLEMRNKYDIYTCQAKGQYFWSSDKELTRLQSEGIADFMPQLFFVNGVFADKTKVFNNISITNEYTSEQCLGDSFLKYSNISRLGRLNNDSNNWLSYTDGVIWQCMTDGRPGRP